MTDQRWTVRRGSVPALFWPDDENPDMPFSFTEADMAEMLPDALDRQVSAMFAAIVDAVARDTQVREIVGQQGDDFTCRYCPGAEQIAALYAKPTDDSDIMHGSESDGPVVL